MSGQSTGHFEFLPDYPADVLAISAIGHIDHDDYEKTLFPAIEKAVKREGKVKILYLMGPAFDGFTAGAIFEDAKFGLTHLSAFARIAVVSDVDWIRAAMKLVAPFMHDTFRLFSVAELDNAKEWITTYKPESDGPQKNVAVDGAILPLEDKTPPAS